MAKIFISHKSSKTTNLIAAALRSLLEDEGYGVFVDVLDLRGGAHWDKKIFGEISTSDVLIVLVTTDAASTWVQREIDYARGCRVQILPVVLDEADIRIDPKTGRELIAPVMNKLELDRLQRVTAPESLNDPRFRFQKVLASLPELIVATRKAQEDWVNDELKAKWKADDHANPKLNPPKNFALNYATYAVIQPDLKPHSCQLVLAAGDITQTANVDVLVNSENVYMQMERVFDRQSVSKTIRRRGAKFYGQQIQEDTIQQQLNEQLFSSVGTGVPVRLSDVLVTAAGHQKSDLHRQHIKRIFHVAAVDAHLDNGLIRVKDRDVVKRCVVNCLQEIESRNVTGEALSSIIFPLLGTGIGGLEIPVAADAMIEACHEHLRQYPDTLLKKIYLSAYTLGSIEAVKDVLDRDQNLRAVRS